MVVSVIIPTMARTQLAAAVSSVYKQDLPVEVLVVNDSGAPLERAGLPEEVRVLDTRGQVGAAAARNIGLEHASGEYIALLDDDDEWLRGHLADALHIFEQRPDIDIYSCRSLVIDANGRGRIEPVELLREGKIRDHLYGRSTWYSRSRRIPTPTLVFRRRLAVHPQDVTMRRRQDTWWLLTAERDFGAQLYQSAHIGVVVYVDRPRQDRIDATADHFAWAQRLESIQSGTGAAQVIVRARQAARAGAVDAFPQLAAELRGLGASRRHRTLLALHRIAARGIRTGQVMRGR